MSVIFGKIHLDAQPVTNDDLDVMKKRLNHWQADAEGQWHEGETGLGHLMLYNTPESLNERLPLHNDITGCTITADARIDNREELYDLLNLNAEERKAPDSTLILKLYEKYGAECIKHLIGDFAFAIWDARNQQLFCARDQMGVKPFFYYSDRKLFAFASEKKGILVIERINLDINKEFLYNQLIWPPQQRNDTSLYLHIKRLPPAHILIIKVQTGQIALRRYWDFDTASEINLKQKSDYYDAFKFHFDNAVKCRLRTIHPIGAELSGGLDSSGITGAASKILNNQKLITFSNIVSDNITDAKVLRLNERVYIDEVLKFNSIKDAVFVTDNIWANAIEEADFILEVNDGLEMWTSQGLIPIKKAANERSVRTILSGFPGDEMVTHRGKKDYFDLDKQDNYIKYILTAKDFKSVFRRTSLLISPTLKQPLYKLNKFASYFTTNHHGFDIPISYWLKRNAMNNELFSSKSYRHLLRSRISKSQVGLRMEAETRYGIYFKLEPRYPMADIRLTQFYLSMPNTFKYEENNSRSAYRHIVNEYLPELIQNRQDKVGATAPFRIYKKNIQHQQEAALKIAHSIQNQCLIKIKHADKVSFVDLISLRWLQKNF